MSKAHCEDLLRFWVLKWSLQVLEAAVMLQSDCSSVFPTGAWLWGPFLFTLPSSSPSWDVTSAESCPLYGPISSSALNPHLRTLGRGEQCIKVKMIYVTCLEHLWYLSDLNWALWGRECFTRRKSTLTLWGDVASISSFVSGTVESIVHRNRQAALCTETGQWGSS